MKMKNINLMKMYVENSRMSSFQLDCNMYNSYIYISNILTIQCLLLYMQYLIFHKICINIIPKL